MVAQAGQGLPLLDPLAAPHQEFPDHGPGRGRDMDNPAAGQELSQAGDVIFEGRRRGRGRLVLEGEAGTEEKKGDGKTADHNQDQQPRPFLPGQPKPLMSISHKASEESAFVSPEICTTGSVTVPQFFDPFR